MRILIFSFAIWPLVHLLTLPLTSFLYLKFEARMPIFAGLLVLAIAMWLIGRVNFFGYQASHLPATSIKGLIVLGIASGLIQPSINHEVKASLVFTARTSQINN